MWSMTGAVGQPKMHRAQRRRREASPKQREEMHLAGRRVAPDLTGDGPFDVTNLLRDGLLGSLRSQTKR
jgi:hypothetical protein